jgi:UDP-glucose:glycoprotein glucosyltransferase
MAKIFAYSIKTFGRGVTRQILEEVSLAVVLDVDQIASRTPSTPSTPGIVNQYIAQSVYDGVAANSGKTHLSFDQILAQPIDEEKEKKIDQYTSRLAATRLESKYGHVFVNGKYAPFDLVSR